MASLQERVAARRVERAKEHTFVLPVTGYEDVGLKARYRVLTYVEIREIMERSEDLEGPEGELARYADTIAEACLDLLDGEVSLGCKWSSSTSVLRERVGLDCDDQPSARDNVFAVFNGTTGGADLFLHWTEWDLEASKAAKGIDEEQAGESPASAEGSSRSELTPSQEASL